MEAATVEMIPIFPEPSQSSVLVPKDMTLQQAAYYGHEDLLDYFLECCTEGQININALDKEGFAALHYAVMYHRVNIIKKLLAANCDPDVLTKDFLTPLHIAARYLPRSSGAVTETESANYAKCISQQVIQMLIQPDEEGVRDSLIGKFHWRGIATPLHMACSRANVPAVQELLKHIQEVDRSIVNMKGAQGNTPLHEACNHGSLVTVKELLYCGADVDAQNYFGEMPLHTACKGNYVEVVKEILHHNRERAAELVNVCDNRSNYPMHLAVKSGNPKMVMALQNYKVHPSVQNDVGVAPIHIAAGQGYTDIANTLLDQDNSCKDLLDNRRRSPLHYAARTNQMEMIQLLISKECDKEVPDENLVTPLLLSVKSGKADAVKALIMGGCELNTTDRDGRSAVYWAAQEGHMDVLRVLLNDERGVLLVHVPEPHHFNTPLHIAAKMGRVQAIELLATHLVKHLHQLWHRLSEEREAICMNDPSATEKLQTLDHKANEMKILKLKAEHLDFRNDENTTPLHLAAIFGHMEVVCLLVHKHPPSLTDKDSEGHTPLHLAVIHGHIEVIRFLAHKHPSSLTDGDRYNKTPLHLAALHGRTEVTDVLIHQGAEVDARDRLQRTPLHLAAMKSHAEIVALLIEADALLEAKDNRNMTPLHWSVKSNAEIISLLIDAGAQLEAKEEDGRTPLFLACEEGHLAAAEVLMHRGADVTAHVKDHSTKKKLNCLDVAVREEHKNIALAIIQLYGWENALRHSDGQMTPFKRMIQQMPSVAEAVLDRCMWTNAEWDEDPTKVEVQFNYEFLDDYRDESSEESWTEMILSCFSSVGTEDENEWRPKYSAKDHPLALMVKYKRDDLLRHPVVTSLLDYKWWKYGGAIFLFNLITYLIFLSFLTMYALLLPHPDHRFCHDFSVTQSVASLPVNGTVCPFESAVANYSRVLNTDPTVPDNNHANVALYFAAVVVIITAAARLLLVELVQLVKTHYHYFLKIENYIELLAYLSSIIFVSHFGTNCWCSRNWQWQLGAFGVFLAWINLILFLKRVPLLGIYVLMFNVILHTFLKFALIAFLFVVAFCIAFYMILYKALDDATLIGNVSPFRNAGLSFIKTMVMALGELDYDTIFGHSNDSSSMLTFPVVAYILWIIFLIVMPILLANLLVGLAVGDIKEVQDQAQLESNLLQIEADELLPTFIRCKFKRQLRRIYPNQQGLRLWWGRFMKRVSGAERCDSIGTIRKHKEMAQSQTEQLSREVTELRTEMTEQLSREVRKLQKAMSPIEQVQSQTEQLSRQVKNLQIELMEKNNCMEQVLMLMAKKQDIQWDPEEVVK